MNLPSSITSRLLLDWSNVIFDRSNLIFDQSKIVQRVFKKHKFFTCLLLFKLFQNVLSLSLRSVKVQRNFFCHFPWNFFKGFWLLRPVRPFYPSFCIYFHVSCIKSCNFRKISNQWIFGIFDDSSCFSSHWSIGFCCKMLYDYSCWFNLINLVICEKLKILGLEYTRIGGFCSIWFKLMKLAC